MSVLWQSPHSKTMPSIWEGMCGVWHDGTFQKVCHSKRRRVVNKIEVEMSQEYSKGEIETVSIDFVHMNKNWSLLTGELEMHAGNNKILVLYKIDTGSEGNIKPYHIFKRLFKNISEAELKKTTKRHIKLKTYNKTVITQLSTCAVTINFKDNKKRCEFFVVLRNGQALLGMPNTATLKIITINIDSIKAVEEECNTNTGKAKESNARWEVHVVEQSCTNTDGDSKVDNNVISHNNITNITYTNQLFPFFDKCRSRQKEMHQANTMST